MFVIAFILIQSFPF